MDSVLKDMVQEGLVATTFAQASSHLLLAWQERASCIKLRAKEGMPVCLLLVPEPKGLGLSGNSFILLGVLGRVLSMELMAKLGGAETIAGLLPRASMKLVADLAESMRHGSRTIEGSTGRFTPIRA